MVLRFFPVSRWFGGVTRSTLAAAGLLVLVVATACTQTAKPPEPAPEPAAAGVDATALPAAPTASALAVPTDPKMAQGQQIWTQYCALCHGPDREGYAADNAPSLKSKQFLQTATVPFLRAAIERGRPGTAMAGYARALGGPLTPEQIDVLMAWIRRDAPPAVPLSLTPIVGDLANGQVLYAQKCQTCHGTQQQRADAVHLYNPMLLATALDSYLEYAILNGRDGTKMEAWKDKLQPKEVADLVAWLRSQAKPVPSAFAAIPQSPVGQAADPSAVAPEPPPEEPVEHDPVVINPKGGKPVFTDLRDNRFAPIDQVAKALKDKKRIIIIDARAGSDWKRMHITGSISRPYYNKKRLDDIPNDGTWVIAYCACPHHASGEVVDELKRRGYPNVAVLDEGVFAWQQKGYPIVAEPGAVPVPTPPHVPHGAATGHEGHNHGPVGGHGPAGGPAGYDRSKPAVMPKLVPQAGKIAPPPPRAPLTRPGQVPQAK